MKKVGSKQVHYIYFVFKLIRKTTLKTTGGSEIVKISVGITGVHLFSWVDRGGRKGSRLECSFNVTMYIVHKSEVNPYLKPLVFRCLEVTACSK